MSDQGYLNSLEDVRKLDKTPTFVFPVYYSIYDFVMSNFKRYSDIFSMIQRIFVEYITNFDNYFS